MLTVFNSALSKVCVLVVSLFLCPLFVHAHPTIPRSGTDSVLSKLRSNLHIKQSSSLVVIFINLGECIKCSQGIQSTLDSVVGSHSSDSTAVVAIVRVDRQVEVKVFVKNNDWQYLVYGDDDNLRRQLGVPALARLGVFDSENNLIGVLRQEDFAPTASVDLSRLLTKARQNRHVR
jgi:hypothetical protein